jgi:hypothetical protein
MKWKVAKSKIHGNGIFAAADIGKNEDIGVSIPMLEDTQNERKFQRNTFGLLINDSLKPNVKCVKQGNNWHFVSLRPIAEDEEIVVNYQDYIDKIDLESFIAGKRVSVI